MCCVVAITVVDLAAVNVALPSIQADLGTSAADLQWVVVVYSVIIAGFLMLGGRGGDLLGHRRMLVAGIVLLALSSLLAGLSDSLAVLLVGRAGQGFGAAMATPNALAILSHTYAEGAERNRALGIFGAAGAGAAVFGSVLGGLLVEGPGWQWAFFINVPFGLLVAVSIAAVVPADEPRRDQPTVDFAGAATLTLGLMALVLALHQSIGGRLSVGVLVPLAFGLAMLGTFLRVEAGARDPLIPLATLTRRAQASANLSATLLWAAFLGLTYELTLFLQQTLGYSPLAAGASTLPIAVVALLTSGRLAPGAIDRLGAAATIALGAGGVGAGALLLLRAGPEASYPLDLLPAFLVVGLGIGLAQVAIQIAAFAGIESDEAGLAAGAIETSSEIGAALGLALVVAFALANTDAPGAAFHRGLFAIVALAAAVVPVTMLLMRPAEPGSGSEPAESPEPELSGRL